MIIMSIKLDVVPSASAAALCNEGCGKSHRATGTPELFFVHLVLRNVSRQGYGPLACLFVWHLFRRELVTAGLHGTAGMHEKDMTATVGVLSISFNKPALNCHTMLCELISNRVC